MLSELTVRDFKRIEEVNLDFARINIFVGPNGAGKSTILEAIKNKLPEEKVDYFGHKNKFFIKDMNFYPFDFFPALLDIKKFVQEGRAVEPKYASIELPELDADDPVVQEFFGGKVPVTTEQSDIPVYDRKNEYYIANGILASIGASNIIKRDMSYCLEFRNGRASIHTDFVSEADLIFLSLLHAVNLSKKEYLIIDESESLLYPVTLEQLAHNIVMQKSKKQFFIATNSRLLDEILQFSDEGFLKIPVGKNPEGKMMYNLEAFNIFLCSISGHREIKTQLNENYTISSSIRAELLSVEQIEKLKQAKNPYKALFSQD